MRTRNSGFTLTELTVLVLAAVIFAAILLPALAEQRENEEAVICRNNLMNIGRAVEMYKRDNDGWIPANATKPGPAEDWWCGNPACGDWIWREAIWAYIAPGTDIPFRGNTPMIFNCPSDRGEMARLHILQSSYNMNSHRYRKGGEDFMDGIGRGHNSKGDAASPLSVPESGSWWTHENWVEDSAGTIMIMDGRTSYWSWRYHDSIEGPHDLLPPDKDRSISPQGPKHGGRYNFLFCDGSVRPYELEETVGTGEYDLDNRRALGMWTKTRGD